MSFLSGLVSPYRKGEKNFERGRAAELRSDFAKAEEYFTDGAAAFDLHLAEKRGKNGKARPSHLVMAGVCYTRVGRYEDALRALDACLAEKGVPDALLNAGYAAAKLGLADRAVGYWKDYPDWAGQRVIAGTLKEQIRAIREGGEAVLQEACEAVARAVFDQDRVNARDREFRGKNHKTSEFLQGY